MPSVLERAVRCRVGTNFRVRGGAVEVSRAGLEALASLARKHGSKPLTQRRVASVLGSKRLSAFRMEDAWFALQAVPHCLAMFGVGAGELDLLGLESDFQKSLIINLDGSEEEVESVGASASLPPEPKTIAPRTSSKRPRSGSSVAKLKMKVSRLQRKLVDMKRCADLMTDDQIRRRYFQGRKARYLSIQGGFSIVLRRIIANTGARSIVAASEIDLHRTTLNQWEIRFHASLLASWRKWYAEMHAQLFSDTPASAFVSSRYAVHILKGDATNSRNTAKIHSMEIQSLFLLEDVRHSDAQNFTSSMQIIDAIECRSAMSNMFEVKNGTALATHALYLEHMRSVGCPSWSSFAGRQVPANIVVTITYFLATDGGPDEVGAKDQAAFCCRLASDSGQGSCTAGKRHTLLQQ